MGIRHADFFAKKNYNASAMEKKTQSGAVVLCEKRGGWRKLTLNRPDKLNSVNAETHAALARALADLRGDPDARALLLTGAGRAFCAGQDLGERAVAPGQSPPDLGESLRARYNPLVLSVAALPIPVVCAVNGVAAGAGANLALACDFVLAAKSAKFIQAFCNIGLIPDSGGTWILPRLAGSARARTMAMLGEPVSAETAAEWGMIFKCVEDDDLPAESEALTERLSRGPTMAYGMIKQALARGTANSLAEQLALEADLQSRAGQSADYAEGVAAFREKRKPVFRGK